MEISGENRRYTRKAAGAFQTGSHGFGKKGGGADHYLDRLEEWLKLNGWLTKPSK